MGIFLFVLQVQVICDDDAGGAEADEDGAEHCRPDVGEAGEDGEAGCDAAEAVDDTDLASNAEPIGVEGGGR